MDQGITRREAIKRLAKLGGAAALTVGFYGTLHGRASQVEAENIVQKTADFRVKGVSNKVVVVQGVGQTSPATLVKEAVSRLGGLEKFVSRGDVVAVKVNVSWDRSAELAANTNPEVAAAVVGLCLDAGAAKVNLVDNTINAAERTFRNSGLEAAAVRSGARLIYPASRLFKTMSLGGRRLDQWEVYTPVIEADKLINLPVAKHHGLTRLTLGMKSWIGAVGGNRGALHQDIHQSIADLARFFQPTLTIIDATRIMVGNGPSGGRLSDVVVKNTIIAGTDQVMVDAAALPLFDMYPDEIGYLMLGENQGLGRIEPEPGQLVEVQV